MRLLIIFAVLAASTAFGGCKTAEIAVSHPLSGVHIACKFEAKDDLYVGALPGTIALQR